MSNSSSNNNNSSSGAKQGNILTSFFGKLKRFVMRESPINNPLSSVQGSEVVDKEGVDVVLQRFAVIGLFDTIQSIAEAGKGSVNGLTTSNSKLPNTLLRVFINGIINACVMIEEVLEREDTTKPAETATVTTTPKTVAPPSPGGASAGGGGDDEENDGLVLEDDEDEDDDQSEVAAIPSEDDGQGEEEPAPNSEQEEFDAILKSFGVSPKKGQA